MLELKLFVQEVILFFHFLGVLLQGQGLGSRV